MKEQLFKQLVLQAFGNQQEILFEDGCLEKFFEFAYQSGYDEGWCECIMSYRG